MIQIWDQQLTDGTNEVFDDMVEVTDTPEYLGYSWHDSNEDDLIDRHAKDVFQKEM